MEKVPTNVIADHDDEMVSDNSDTRSADDFQVTCNIVSVLLIEYDCVPEVSKAEGDSHLMTRLSKSRYVIMLRTTK